MHIFGHVIIISREIKKRSAVGVMSMFDKNGTCFRNCMAKMRKNVLCYLV